MMVRLAAGVLLIAALALGGYCWLDRHNLPKQAAKLETQYTADTTKQTLVQAVHDSVLAGDAPLPRPAARKIVADERTSCQRVRSTCEARVKNLEKQLRPGWLKLFGEADYDIPAAQPLLQGGVSLRLGALLRLRGGTSAIAYVQQPITGAGSRRFHVGIRQEFRIF